MHGVGADKRGGRDSPLCGMGPQPPQTEEEVMDILWSLLVGFILATVFTRIGWGWEYLGRHVDRWTARWRKL